jgi:putative DNA primase/helicase
MGKTSVKNPADDSGVMRTNLLKNGAVQRTDSTNAEKLVREHGSDIRYNAVWKKWLVWNGKYWETDEGDIKIHGLGLKTIRNIYDGVLLTSDYKERIEIEKFAMKSESMRNRKAMVEAASKITNINITNDELDRNQWLLNVRNGTVDVTTGDFKPHDRADFITKIANVDFDPDADCPVWKKFVREIMNYNNELVMFLQTACGWGITANTGEQVMFILFGSGANGKSTFLNTIQTILGDYAAVTQTETFLKQNADKISNDIARLRGTRFVTAAETEQGKRLYEPVIKQITGNDKLTARFLFSEYFSFYPTFKIFMATNHKPNIKGTDYGIWRRIRLIPFTTTVSKEKQDIELESKLLGEAPGILNWLIEGAKRWKRERLVTPEIILKATDEYRGEMDVIGNFIKEVCVEYPASSVRVRELFKAYQEWCAENNEYANTERFFGMRLKEIGFKQTRTAEARYWSGITLKAKLTP